MLTSFLADGYLQRMEPVELGIDMSGAGQMYDASQAPAPAT